MKRIIFCLSLLNLLSSCAGFEGVNSFAISSEKSINNYKSIAYTFFGNCNYKCTQRSLESPVFQTAKKNCSCEEAILADKNVNRLLSVLKIYFKGMANLSDNKLTVYSFNAIEKPLIEGKYIKKADIKPYTNIAGLVTMILTDNYRAKNLKRVIETANSDIILLLEKTAEIIENNLVPTLSSRQSDIQQIYHDLYVAPGTSAYEKFNIQKNYFSELTSIAAKKEVLKKYCSALTKISKGHQSLYDNKDKLKEKGIKKMIAAYADDLNDIVEQFKK